jgi:hypothetical protein
MYTPALLAPPVLRFTDQAVQRMHKDAEVPMALMLWLNLVI